MKPLKLFTFYFLLLITAVTMTGCYTPYYAETTPVRQNISYINPNWAPEYHESVRYYYLPDIECYYDLSAGQYVYLRNGRWYNSNYFPSFYYDFNIDNCFVVILSSDVYRPWMHHQYYLTHYPRYYYRDYYDYSNFPYVRGFNENLRSAIYWNENERYKARDWDDRNIRSNKNFKYSEKDRQYQRNIINSGYGRNENKNDYDNDNDNVGRPDVDGKKEIITPDRNGVSNRDDGRSQGRKDDNASVRSGSTSQTRSETTNRNQTGTQTRTDTNQRNAQTSGQTSTVNTETSQRRTDAAGQTRTETTNKRGTDAAGQTRTETTNRANAETSQRGSDAATQTRSGGGTVARTRSSQTRSDSIQGTNYYGRTIGNPVKVNKQMQDNSQTEKSSTRSGSSSGSNSGRRR